MLADRSALVFVLFFALYALGAARTVQGGDAGEFMTIAALGGVAHPSGYPLVTALMRLAMWLPVGGVPWKASLVSAACAAGALAVLHRAIVEATARPLAGWVAVVALGFSPVFWRYATVAEVFAGGALTGALVLLVAVRVAGGWQGPRAALALGLAVATGIANHHSVVFLAPLAVWAFVAGIRNRRECGWNVLACTLGLGLGLVPYALLMIPGGAWRWGETTTLRGLVDHFLRRDYGTLRLTAEGAAVAWWEHPWRFLAALPDDFVVVFVVLAVVGLARPGRHRVLWWVVAATVLTAGPLFFALFNVPASAMGLVVAERFHVLPHVFIAGLAGVGAARLAGRMLPGLVVVAAIVSALTHAAHGSHARWTVLDDYARNVLDALEPHALFVAESDSIVGALLYLQEVERLRPDVIVFVPALQRARWYRDHVRARHPDFEPANLYPYTPLAQLVATSLAVRPVYVTFNVAPALGGVARMYPESGIVMRVAAPGQPIPSRAVIEAQMGRAVHSQRRHSWPADDRQWHGTWEGWVVDEYGAAWRALAEVPPGN